MPTEDATGRFHRLIWPHLATVLRTAMFLTRNATEAEDLAQETMLKAYRFMDSLQEGTDAKAWLMAILRNTRIDRLRAAGRMPDAVAMDDLPADPAAPEASAADPAARWENPREILNDMSDATIIAALKSLPEEIRLTLLLTDVEGLDHAQAAEILKVPTGTIKSRAHRGRAMLRDLLQHHVHTGGAA